MMKKESKINMNNCEHELKNNKSVKLTHYLNFNFTNRGGI